MNTEIPTRKQIDEMSAEEIKKELVKTHERMGKPETFFTFNPSDTEMSFDALCKETLLFLLDWEKFENGEPQTRFKKVNENDFKLK